MVSERKRKHRSAQREPVGPAQRGRRSLASRFSAGDKCTDWWLTSYYCVLVRQFRVSFRQNLEVTMAHKDLKAALDELGPLEGRIMRLVWGGAVKGPFVVRSIQLLLADLAYTTVMTTLNRLAEKGILTVEAVPGQRAHRYMASMNPSEFLVWASRREVEQMIARYGDHALVAFADRVDKLSSLQRERLRKLSGR